MGARRQLSSVLPPILVKRFSHRLVRSHRAAPERGNGYPRLRRFLVAFSIGLYGAAIFLALDYGYSRLRQDDGIWPRHWSAVYHHGLVVNFDGWDNWGDVRYRLVTNNLGLRDAVVRDVPERSAQHRVLLIGDSFTEGIGVAFEESFAGMLYAAGQRHAEKIEFLNAGTLSYSPTLYHARVKALLDRGLRFDEVVVLSDVSDVRDEARNYFCQDEDPDYRTRCKDDEPLVSKALCASTDPNLNKYCNNQELYRLPRFDAGSWFARHFPLTDLTRVWIKFEIQRLIGKRKQRWTAPTMETEWLFPDPVEAKEYAPLGPDGGIRRSLRNMQRLADLLRSRDIPLTIAVYPWPVQLARNDVDSRQVNMWRDFCATNCKQFINIMPAFFAEKQRHADWYERLYIPGDIHYSADGNSVMFRELATHLLPPHARLSGDPGASGTGGN
jgi:hypothetical protein